MGRCQTHLSRFRIGLIDKDYPGTDLLADRVPRGFGDGEREHVTHRRPFDAGGIPHAHERMSAGIVVDPAIR